ncbi:MAG: ATP-binding protein [Thermodesulfobacteriota bacterium]
MHNPLAVINRRLRLKIALAVTAGVALVMAGVIWLALASQRAQMRERLTSFGRQVTFMAYAGIRHPMGVGDSPSVERQLLDLDAALADTEIAICDFESTIIFSTDKLLLGQPASVFARHPRALAALTAVLADGPPPAQDCFEEVVDGRRFLVNIQGIPNSEPCHHCHGTSRQTLGGMLVRQRTDETYAAIASLGSRTVAISLLGIAAIIAVIHLLLAHLVTRPVSELAVKAAQLATGDLDVSVQVRSHDSIGVLAEAFNAMVRGIRERIELVESLKGAIADPLFTVDTGMTITYMNEAAARLTGYSRQEVEGRMTCRDVFASDICDGDCPIQQAFARGESVTGVRVMVTDRAGRRTPMMASASPLRDGQGRLIGGVEIARDLTPVLEAEHLRYVQEAAGREEEQRRYLESRSENLLAILARAAQGDLAVRAEVLGKDDAMDAIAGHTNTMLDNVERMCERISSFSRELETEVGRRTVLLREKTLLLERANRELRELDRLKSSFLANMSHELRTPMNSIIGYTDLLLDEVDGAVNGEQRNSLEKVANNARHLLQLINDILDMSKIESGKIELDPRPTHVRDLLNGVLVTFEPLIEKKGLTLTLDLSSPLPPIFVDEDKIRQVVINLLSNAVKFTEQGGITLTARPSARGTPPGLPPRFLEIAVADTGIGIREEDMDKLFDKFSQIDMSMIRQYEGTGLGLSIARGLVVLHKGVIWAESQPGRGSRFAFTVPTDPEILATPAQPIVEEAMAQGLADLFDKDAATFLAEPAYAGRPIRCWEYLHCGQTSCPAYGSDEHRCWLIHGTHCRGTKLAAYPEKLDFCKGCEIIERLILENQVVATSPPSVCHLDRPVVLAVDDNPEVIDLIRKYLAPDYEVVGLLGGQGVLQHARQLRPVAITLDIMMPGADGWQILQLLKASPDTQDIPVIIVSVVDEKKHGFSLGAAEYLVKPVDRALLLHRLGQVARLDRIRSVLVVDDDAATVERLLEVLASAGHETASAATGRAAIAAVDSRRPDLVVMNPFLADPELDLFLGRLRADPALRDLPLILVTRREVSPEELAHLNGRIQAILHQGRFSPEALMAELKTVIDRWQGTAEGGKP